MRTELKMLTENRSDQRVKLYQRHPPPPLSWKCCVQSERRTDIEWAGCYWAGCGRRRRGGLLAPLLVY